MNLQALDAEQIACFQRDGFLKVDGALTPDEIARYGRAVDRTVAVRTADDLRAVSEKTLYEQSFVQCINLWEDDEDVRRLSFHPGLGQMAAQLLGADAVRLWHDQALYKEAGGRETDPHQDRPFWPIEPADQVTAWIPFDGSRRGAGAMAYVPGSHRLGLERFVDITHLLHDEPYDVLADPSIRDIAPVWVECEPGSIVFHHSLTVHLAEPNTGTETRRVHCVIYFADGCVRRTPIPHITVDRLGIEVGEAIRGDVTPIVWPRPDGDLPPVPATRAPRRGFR